MHDCPPPSAPPACHRSLPLWQPHGRDPPSTQPRRASSVAPELITVLRPLGQVQGGAHHPQQLLDVRVTALPAQLHRGPSVHTDSDLYGGGK
jgi:hypothetical protein